MIQLFKGILLKETSRRAQLPGLVRHMRDEVVSYREEKFHREAPAIAPETTVEQVSSGYRLLQRCSDVSFLYLAGTLAYNILNPGLMLALMSLALGTIGVMWHFSFVIRAYRAREVVKDWENRHKPYFVTYSEVIDAAMADPLILLPTLKPLRFPSGKILKK